MKKRLLIFTAIVIAVVSALVCTKNSKQKENAISMNLTESKLGSEVLQLEAKELEIVSFEENEIVVRNTSGKKIAKIEVTIDDITYYLYDMLPGENYKFSIYSTKEEVDLKVIAVDYEYENYSSNKISLANLTINKKIVEGAIKTNIKIAPSQIIYFLKDKDGNTIQKVIHYESELHEENIIMEGKAIGFVDELGSNFNENKKIVFNYLDIESNELKTVLLEK